MEDNDTPPTDIGNEETPRSFINGCMALEFNNDLNWTGLDCLLCERDYGNGNGMEMER